MVPKRQQATGSMTPSLPKKPFLPKRKAQQTYKKSIDLGVYIRIPMSIQLDARLEIRLQGR
jgi:hypothetical protein